MLFEIPVVVVMLESIPEAFLTILVGLKLFNLDIDLKEALGISMLYGVIAYFIRRYIGIFGLHTLISIVIMVVLTKEAKGITLFRAMACILSAVLLTGVFQLVTVPILLKIMDMPFEQMFAQPKIAIFAALPTFVLMGFIYLILKKTNFYLHNFEVSEGE